jgi:hypothetical protein
VLDLVAVHAATVAQLAAAQAAVAALTAQLATAAVVPPPPPGGDDEGAGGAAGGAAASMHDAAMEPAPLAGEKRLRDDRSDGGSSVDGDRGR